MKSKFIWAKNAAQPAMLRIACRSYVKARLEILTVDIIRIAVAVL